MQPAQLDLFAAPPPMLPASLPDPVAEWDAHRLRVHAAYADRCAALNAIYAAARDSMTESEWAKGWTEHYRVKYEARLALDGEFLPFYEALRREYDALPWGN